MGNIIDDAQGTGWAESLLILVLLCVPVVGWIILAALLSDPGEGGESY